MSDMAARVQGKIAALEAEVSRAEAGDDDGPDCAEPDPAQNFAKSAMDAIDHRLRSVAGRILGLTWLRDAFLSEAGADNRAGDDQPQKAPHRRRVTDKLNQALAMLQREESQDRGLLHRLSGKGATRKVHHGVSHGSGPKMVAEEPPLRSEPAWVSGDAIVRSERVTDQTVARIELLRSESSPDASGAAPGPSERVEGGDEGSTVPVETAAQASVSHTAAA